MKKQILDLLSQDGMALYYDRVSGRISIWNEKTKERILKGIHFNTYIQFLHEHVIKVDNSNNPFYPSNNRCVLSTKEK